MERDPGTYDQYLKERRRMEGSRSGGTIKGRRREWIEGRNRGKGRRRGEEEE